MTQPNYLGENEETELREKWGYDDREIEMVSEAHRYSKMADDLRAQAAQSAHQRLRPEGPGDGGSAGIEGWGGTVK